MEQQVWPPVIETTVPRPMQPLISALYAEARPYIETVSVPAALITRALDIIVSLAALLVGFPVMLMLALIIRLDSPGPALFRQQRLGKHAEPFTFYKFRTMYVDARERFPELYAYRYSPEEISTMRFKVDPDPRLTRVGRWLRKTTLDELPNFLNVLLGTMTLVGPRPEIPEMLPYYRPSQRAKFEVKPGATGLAQISGRGRLTLQETINYDLEYCARRSLRYDLWIFVTTVKSVLRHDGAF